LSDFIHAPKGLSVVNLSLTDLRHRLNALRHKPTSKQPSLLCIPANSISEYNRLDKLQHIQSIFQVLPGYLDHNWMYHDRSVTIMVEFSNLDYSYQAHHEISANHPELEIYPIDDLRQLLQRSQTPALHSQRSYDPNQQLQLSNVPDPSQLVQHPELAFAYRLRHVPPSLSHVQIQNNLSYYGNIESIQEVDNLSLMQRELIITFDKHAKHSLLARIWAVNIQGYNIFITSAHLSNF